MEPISILWDKDKGLQPTSPRRDDAQTDVGGGSRESKHRNARGQKSDTQEMREQIRQLALALFFREDAPIRSLGFTSSIEGEGKTFLASAMASTLAGGCSAPTTLIECNWEHRCLHELFDLPATPGLAEWLRAECELEDIRHEVARNLTVIPAGDGLQSAVRLMRQMRQGNLASLLESPDELIVLDLPPVVTCAYGVLAAGLADSLIVVARARVTPEPVLAETVDLLADLPVHGLVLNQIESRIPRWLQQLL